MIVIAAITVSAAVYGQAQINTKKVLIEDFSEKVTKVVLTGNVFLDTGLEKAVKDCWKISPYEFCSLEEFKSIKDNSDYYFLIPVSAQFRKEVSPGLVMLSLLKGGKGADKSIDKMLEVVTVPFCPADDQTGREMAFLPALVDIIQIQAAAAVEKDLNGYVGLKINMKNLAEATNMNIVFAESDIAFNINDKDLSGMGKKSVQVVSDEEAEDWMESHAENTLVSYSVYPTDPQPNSYCYNLMIDAKTHKLYYYRRYKITKNSGAGFQKEDFVKILR